MTGRDYRDLLAWQKALELVKTVYKETAAFPRDEIFGIVAQLRRASVSISSNIAEGQGRRSKGEFLRYLHIALGSLAEAETQILISQNLGFLRQKQAERLISLTSETGRLINGLVNALRNQQTDR
jgi:four helix bundle protein